MLLGHTFIEWLPIICYLLIAGGMCSLTIGKWFNSSKITDEELNIIGISSISAAVGFGIFYLFTIVWV